MSREGGETWGTRLPGPLTVDTIRIIMLAPGRCRFVATLPACTQLILPWRSPWLSQFNQFWSTRRNRELLSRKYSMTQAAP